MNTITFLGGGVIFPLRPSQTAAQTWIIKHLLRFLHIFNNMHGTLIAARARIWIIISSSTKRANHHQNEIPLCDVIPGWEKSLSETEKWILANLFDWFVNQIIQRRKLRTRCTLYKHPSSSKSHLDHPSLHPRLLPGRPLHLYHHRLHLFRENQHQVHLHLQHHHLLTEYQHHQHLHLYHHRFHLLRENKVLSISI